MPQYIQPDITTTNTVFPKNAINIDNNAKDAIIKLVITSNFVILFSLSFNSRMFR